MFKRSKSLVSDKSKQLSIFDFFSGLTKKHLTNSHQDQQEPSASTTRTYSADDCNITTKKRKISKEEALPGSSMDKAEKVGRADICPSQLLDALDSCQQESQTSCHHHVTKNEKSVEKEVDKVEIHQVKEDVIFPVDSGDMFQDESPLLFDSESQDQSTVQNNFNAEKTKSKKSRTPTPSPQGPVSLGVRFDSLKRTPLCSESLPILSSSPNHTVLFDETFPGHGPPPPRDPRYQDAWDSHHVRLPCSPKNLYPAKIQNPLGKEDSLERRWEIIESSLLTQISNSIDLEEAILSYNSRYANQWTFRALHKFFTEDVDENYRRKFFSSTLPAVVRLALSLPQLCTQPIPLLCRQKNHRITLSQQQIACLLCNAFLCTFPWRNSRKAGSEYSNYPDINFNRLLMGSESKDSVITEKLKMFFHYFERVTTNMPSGSVTFERRAISNFPKWHLSPCMLCDLHITSEGTIETEGAGMLQVDFANRYIGGGVLGFGAVQEEIRFCICPELVVSRLFSEALDNNECIFITGAEQYSCYSGYGNSMKWAGDFVDVTERDEWRRRRTEIVAMDALSRPTNQYSAANIRRELNKAFCGFYCSFELESYPAIATGNWGCGAFGGDPMLKSLLQLLAAAAVGRELCFFTFNDIKLAFRIYEMYSYIKEKNLLITCPEILQVRGNPVASQEAEAYKWCDVWRTLMRYNSEIITAGASEKVFDFLKRIHDEYDSSTDESNGA